MRYNLWPHEMYHKKARLKKKKIFFKNKIEKCNPLKFNDCRFNENGQ